MGMQLGKLIASFDEKNQLEATEQINEENKGEKTQNVVENFKNSFGSLTKEELFFDNFLIGLTANQEYDMPVKDSIRYKLPEKIRNLYDYFSKLILSLLSGPEMKTIRHMNGAINIYFWNCLIKYLQISKKQVINFDLMLEKLNDSGLGSNVWLESFTKIIESNYKISQVHHKRFWNIRLSPQRVMKHMIYNK